MPSKWNCQCGSHVPLHQAFCGFCGRRWDKSVKPKQSGKPKPRADPKGQQAEASAASAVGTVGFVVPSVGVQIPSLQPSASSLLPVASNAAVETKTEAAQKSVKTMLHQKANRIGKLENRIKKLEQALQTVQENWPRHVYQLEQALARDHQKCVAFNEAVTMELGQLRTELHGLLSTHAVNPPIVHAQTPLPAEVLSNVNQALDVLQAFAAQHQGTYASGTEPMQVDQSHCNQPAMAMDFSVHRPQVASGIQVPTLPVAATPSPVVQASQAHPQQQAQAQHLHSMTGLQEQPTMPQAPGSWEWPPRAPQLSRPMPNVYMNAPGPMPNTEHLYTKPSEQPNVQSPQPFANQDLPQQLLTDLGTLDSEFMQSIQQAAQGLNDMPTDQGGAGGQGLNQDHVLKLVQFAQQQLQCRKDMQVLQEQMQAAQFGTANTRNTTPGEEMQSDEPPIPAPQTPQHARQSPQDRSAQTPLQRDTMTIASSPAMATPGLTREITEYHSLSPAGQRQQKIPKQVPGHVYEQPNQGVTTPLPADSDEDVEARSPTPVPTEVPTEEENDQFLQMSQQLFQAAPGRLNQLE